MEGLAKDYDRCWIAILKNGGEKKNGILINKILHNSFFMQEH